MQSAQAARGSLALTAQIKPMGKPADVPAVTPDRAMDLAAIGWTEEREQEFQLLRAEGLEQGIIAVSYGRLGTAWTAHGPVPFTVAGRLRQLGQQTRSGLPAVGDWVALR